MAKTKPPRTIDGRKGPFEANAFNCGCVIASEFPNGSGVKTIEYCKVHQAAHALHKALVAIDDSASDGRTIPEWLQERLILVKTAIAQAGGR